jgi:hypothetical protein
MVAIGLAACGGPRAPASPAPSATPYLVLFERGRAWSLPIEVVDASRRANAWVGARPERSSVTCQVAEVKPIGDANVSRVACAVPHADLSIVGTWVATPAGLYHPLLPIDDADELTLLGDDDLLITALPNERQHEHALGGATDSIEAFAFEGSWCVRQSTATASDRRSYTMCFGASGVTGGGELVISGDTLHRARFGAAPEDPDDPTVARDD